MHYYCAIDIETGGPIITVHPLVRIGMAVVNQDGVTVEKQAFAIPFDRSEFEPLCMKEFWQNEESNPGITAMLDLFEREGQQFTMVNALTKFVSYFDTVHHLYPGVIMVGDFVEFDYGVLNYYMGRYLHREPLNYYGGKNYPVQARSSSTFYHAMAGAEHQYSLCTQRSRALELLGVSKPSTLSHDHNPENDAEEIACLYALSKKAFCDAKL